MDKTLIVFTIKDAYFLGRINNNNIDIENIFIETSGLKSIILKLFKKINSSLTHCFYDKWYKIIDEYEKIIVLDACYQYDKKLLSNISKKAPNAKKFFYSWNIVIDEQYYKEERRVADDSGFKYYCYDHGNCEKYNMKFNTIMYDKTMSLPLIDVKYDTLFLGYLKDRAEKMNTLYKAMKKIGLKPRFVITKREGDTEEYPFEYRDKYVDYYEYLDMLNESKAILDIAQEGQDGFSMRVMEAIFLNKKIISTNKALKEASFYNPSNIYVLDLKNIKVEELKEFFERKNVPYSEDIKEYYSFEQWIERFE